MKFQFIGDVKDVTFGLEKAAELLGWELSDKGVTVKVKKIEDNRLSVKKTADGWAIEYGQRAQFFRALGFLNQQKEIAEAPHFESCGWFVDVSQTNALPKISEYPEILGRMALMGMNRLIIYMEDSFEVAEEPYFGYMRSRYSQEELKAIDDIGYEYGIEVFACIEGLSHLSPVLQWFPYGDIQEDGATVLVGEEKTYEFLGHLIDAATKPFRSNRIFILLDEAFGLGRGTSLTRTGEFHPSYYYMKQHMARLVEMCKERGVEMLTSGDMFMVASNPDEKTFFDKLYAINGPFSQEILDAAKAPVDYVLWDYSHLDQPSYEALIARYREFGKTDFFLAGIWNWLGYGVDYDKTFGTIIPALRACKKCNIKDIAVSSWGNDTGMENFWSDLMLGWQLFAEYSYGEEPTDEELAARFKACTGCEMKDFYELSYVDHLYGQRTGVGPDYTNFSRSLMWQDLLFGRFDYYIHDETFTEHFGKVAAALEAAEQRNGEYGKYLGVRALCARVMEIKATLGVRIEKAYKAGDKKFLTDVVENILPELKKRVAALQIRHRDLWYDIYKPLGWEAQELRYGALLGRIDSVSYRLRQYLNGEIANLEELEAERLTITGAEEMPRTVNYINVVSASYIDPGK